MKIDLGAIYQIEAATKQELKNIDRAMRRFADQAAQYEKQNHTYKNRTGNLERSTKGVVSKSGDTFEVSLIAGMDYASYVNARGFMVIDYAAQMMEANIEDYLSRFGFTI